MHTFKPSPDRAIKLLSIGALTLALGISNPAPACGPFFPNAVIAGGDQGLLTLPTGGFIAEIDRLRPAGGAAFKAISPAEKQSVYDQSAEIDLAELRAALDETKTPAGRRDAILAEYAAARHVIETLAMLRDDSYGRNDLSTARAAVKDAAVPDGLPAEFADYLRGLLAFYRDQGDAARECWFTLLNRPARDRKRRSVWATYMIGRSLLAADPAHARIWFQRTRELSRSGFSDPLGLAAASLGWEARANLNEGNISEAMNLYMQQLATGDSTAVMSLRLAARNALSGDFARLDSIARDELSCRVVTAYILADAGPYMTMTQTETQRIPRWLAAVEKSGRTNMAGADRLAWAAYGSGNYTDAARWVSRAPADSAIANWVRAKLLLRQGKIDEAAASLARAVASFPPDSQWLADEPSFVTDETKTQISNVIPPVVGDLAALKLARGQYTDSLDLLLRADFWSDSAYVAERVLTIDELKQFVDRRYPSGETTANPKGDFEIDAVWSNLKHNEQRIPAAIRFLLARRLTRTGRWKEARDYYPPSIRPMLDEYIQSIRAGHDSSRSSDDRAASLMQAARAAHGHGMELLGTALGPDFQIWNGSFGSESDDIIFPERKTISAVSADELSRLKLNAPADTRRFSYRYIAADHAWAAAELMPDESDATAKVLQEAGGWLKARDPKSADRFYKALVRRCGTTDLGKQAAKLHWFPQ